MCLYVENIQKASQQQENKSRMMVLLAVAAILAVSSAASVSMEDLEFHSWKLEHGKTYVSEGEVSYRKMIWLTNRKLVLEHNMLADQGLKNYRLGMNHFADMDNQEFQAWFGSCLGSFNKTKISNAAKLPHQVEGASVPDAVDWRDLGYVTKVKNQGTCGSCWAFSATGALEGQMFRKTGKLEALSEQQLIDCSELFGNDGCHGGWYKTAFKYVKSSGGLQSEASYSYDGTDGMCRFNTLNVSATCKGFKELPSGDESILLQAVASIGPISAAIDMSRDTFRFYSSGVYDDMYCSTTQVNHAVLIVGYGIDERGEDYWTVKNSWGAEWGEKGYIRMSRNKRNQCGIASYTMYPLV